MAQLKTKWGILGTGWIAHQFAQALTDLETAEIVAVGSRTSTTAATFAAQYQIPKRYGSYDALANDPDVEVIYIATPHVFHAENMMMCLNAGKHVLCEKPFTINAQEAETCIALAREKNLFLMEAMWTRFIPALAQVRQWIADGEIGTVRLVRAELSMLLNDDPQGRLYNLELGGGALLDVGIYPVSFAAMILGIPDSVQIQMQFAATGADVHNAMLFQYEGANAILASSIAREAPREALISGDEGYIVVHPMFFRPDRVALHRHNGEVVDLTLPFRSNGYLHQAEAVQACLQQGELEHELMPLAETLAIMRLMDQMREMAGLRYPTED